LITKIAERLFAHATSPESLEKILESRKLLSPMQVAKLNPEAEIDVEYSGLFGRKKAKAAETLGDKDDRDKIFLTEGTYDPRYGNHVIVKKLNHPVKHNKITHIVNEHTTKRPLAITRKSAVVYVPDENVSLWRRAFPYQHIEPLSKNPLKPTSGLQRVGTFYGKVFGKVLGGEWEKENPQPPAKS
jgi:hypothetical protein